MLKIHQRWIDLHTATDMVESVPYHQGRIRFSSTYHMDWGAISAAAQCPGFDARLGCDSGTYMVLHFKGLARMPVLCKNGWTIECWRWMPSTGLLNLFKSSS